MSSLFAADLESMCGVFVQPKGRCGVAASKHKEKAVDGDACSACWIWRQLCVGLL